MTNWIALLTADDSFNRHQSASILGHRPLTPPGSFPAPTRLPPGYRPIAAGLAPGCRPVAGGLLLGRCRLARGLAAGCGPGVAGGLWTGCRGGVAAGLPVSPARPLKVSGVGRWTTVADGRAPGAISDMANRQIPVSYFFVCDAPAVTPRCYIRTQER